MAVENRDDDEEEEEAAAEGEDDDDRDLLAIATALRGAAAVVDAAALDRARAWSMLLEDISRAARERASHYSLEREKERGESEQWLEAISTLVGHHSSSLFFFFGRVLASREQLALLSRGVLSLSPRALFLSRSLPSLRQRETREKKLHLSSTLQSPSSLS